MTSINHKSKAWSMRIKKVGAASPPKVAFCGRQKRSYGGLSSLGVLPIRNLNSSLILLTSLGSIGLGTWPSSWSNPPLAPPTIDRMAIKNSTINTTKIKEMTETIYTMYSLLTNLVLSLAYYSLNRSAWSVGIVSPPRKREYETARSH